jgi:hypothetical protein
MRVPSTLARAALTGVAALALLTACGGGSNNTAGTTSAPTTTTAAPTTSAGPTGADAAFCAAVPQLATQLQAAQSLPPQQAAAQLPQLVANFDKVTPPAALQSDWQTLGTGLHQLAAAVGSLDLSTAQGQQQFQQLAQQAATQAASAQGSISAWVLSNCGGASGTTSAATTS